MTPLPRARELLAQSKTWGPAVEAGILSGHWDTGELIRPFIEQAEQEIIRQRVEVVEE